MTKHKLIIILSIGVLTVLAGLVCGNGRFQTFLRAMTDGKYPDEIAKIEHDAVSFDLSHKDPAILAVGVRYPVNHVPPEFADFKIQRPIRVNFLQSGRIIKSESTSQIHRIYENFDQTQYKVAAIYTFTWSRNLVQRNAKIEIMLNHQFENLDLILFDYGIK